jgi:hypothetical protein
MAISVGSDNYVDSARAGYSHYAFDTILDSMRDYPKRSGNNHRFTDICWQYFFNSFAGKMDVTDWEKEWLGALWDMRTKYGASFVDNAMYHTVGFFRDPNFTDEAPLDLFFYLRFRYGEMVVTDDYEKSQAIDKIIEQHGITIRNKKEGGGIEPLFQ